MLHTYTCTNLWDSVQAFAITFTTPALYAVSDEYRADRRGKQDVLTRKSSIWSENGHHSFASTPQSVGHRSSGFLEARLLTNILDSESKYSSQIHCVSVRTSLLQISTVWTTTQSTGSMYLVRMKVTCCLPRGGITSVPRKRFSRHGGIASIACQKCSRVAGLRSCC